MFLPLQFVVQSDTNWVFDEGLRASCFLALPLKSVTSVSRVWIILRVRNSISDIVAYAGAASETEGTGGIASSVIPEGKSPSQCFWSLQDIINSVVTTFRTYSLNDSWIIVYHHRIIACSFGKNCCKCFETLWLSTPHYMIALLLLMWLTMWDTCVLSYRIAFSHGFVRIRRRVWL